MRKNNAVSASPDDGRSFLLVLKNGDMITCSCESEEEASEWIKTIKQLTFTETKLLDSFIPWDPETYRDIATRYNFFYSPFPAGYTAETFPQSFPIDVAADLLQLAPIISAEILTKDLVSDTPTRYLYILFRTFLFQFHIVSGRHSFVNLESSQILTNNDEFAIGITYGPKIWILMMQTEDQYEHWLAALSFSLENCNEDRCALRSSNDIEIRDLKNPLHSGMLRTPKPSGFEKWHAVFYSNILYLFYSNSPRENCVNKINLLQSSIATSGTQKHQDRVYYLFEITNDDTNETFEFATLASRSRDLWVKVLSIACDEKTRSGSLPTKELTQTLQSNSSPDLSASGSLEDYQISYIDEGSEETSDTDGAKIEGNECDEVEEFPSMYRIPKEDIEGIGLDVASYELLNPYYKGFLLKRGDIVKRWQRRYFVLKCDVVYYFRDITVSRKFSLSFTDN